jgi:hypothetical protein
LSGGFFVFSTPILLIALARYDTPVNHHTSANNHDGTIEIIRLHQGGRT